MHLTSAAFDGPAPLLASESELRALLEKVCAETGVPGIALAVGLGERQTAAAYVGRATLGHKWPVSAHSRFEVGCMMKMFVSFIVLEMAAEGRLGLDAPIAEYIPELRHSRVGSDVQVRHLLSHTGGYAGLDISDARIKWAYDWPEFVEHLRKGEVMFPAGRVFNYEHSEHVVLGEIIRRVMEVPATALVKRCIFDRLDIRPGRASLDRAAGDCYVGQHRQDGSTGRFVATPAPACGKFWASSLPDMTLTTQDLLKIIGLWSSDVLGPALQPSIILPALAVTGTRSEQRPSAYALGCGLYGGGLLGRNGSTLGQTCAVRFHPQSGFALAVSLNAWLPHVRDLVIDRVYALACGRSASFEEVNADRTFAIEQLTGGYPLAEVVGTYRGSYFGQISVTEREQGLVFQFGRSRGVRPAVHVRAVSPDRYVLDGDLPAAIGYFTDPETGAPALMVGVHAYKKTSHQP